MPVTNARQPADCTETGRRTYPSQGHHFPLFFALYQVVEGLHGDERCPAMPFRDMLCFLELPDPHCRNPDVAGLARQSAAVGATPHDAMHLGGDDNLVPPGKILDGASQNFLASAEAVDIGRIKEIDAQIQRSLDDGFAVFFVPRPFVYSAFGIAKAHVAEAQRRDIQTCLPSFMYSLVWGRREAPSFGVGDYRVNGFIKSD